VAKLTNSPMSHQKSFDSQKHFNKHLPLDCS